MKKILIITLLLVMSKTTQACDVCGCGLGGIFFGILPQYNTHYLGLRYSHAAFQSRMDHQSEYTPNERSNDTYQKLELTGRFMLADKWQLQVIVPYLSNHMDGTVQKVTSKGMGDPSAVLYYNVFNSGMDLMRNWRQSLLLGGGVKLPLGEFDKKDGGLLINPNFQLGSGSLDYLISANYTVRYKQVGVNMESGYKLNTKNSQQYRFGNQWNASTYAFYWAETLKVAWLPFAGFYYEEAAMHTDGGKYEINSGGQSLLATLGTQVYHKRLSFNAQYQVPIYQHYHSDDVATITTRGRFSVGLVFSFSLSKQSKNDE
jgi:hypothetical protein